MSDCRAPVEASPDTAFATVAKDELPREFLIRFRSHAPGQALKLEPARIVAPWIEAGPPVALSEDPVFAAEMRVRINDLPEVQSGSSIRTVISVATNSPDCPMIEIPVVVRLRK